MDTGGTFCEKYLDPTDRCLWLYLLIVVVLLRVQAQSTGILLLLSRLLGVQADFFCLKMNHVDQSVSHRDMKVGQQVGLPPCNQASESYKIETYIQARF